MKFVNNEKMPDGSHTLRRGTVMLYRGLASVHFSMVLLGIIALVSILGTFIKQDAPKEEYLDLYSETVYRIIAFLSLNDLYRSPLFFALITLIAINLTLCTVRRFGRLIKKRRGPGCLLPNKPGAIECHKEFDARQKDELLARFKRKYRVLWEDNDHIVLERGAFARFGVPVIHGGILIVLTGALIGQIFGFQGFLTLKVGETADRIVIRGTANSTRALPFALKCTDFKTSLYPGGQPQDFVSTIELIEAGSTVVKKYLRVNDPLSYKGIRFYQSSYGTIPYFQFRVNDEIVKLSERESFEKNGFVFVVMRYVEKIHGLGPGVQIGYLEGGKPETKWFLTKPPDLRYQTIQSVTLRLDEINEIFYTGIAVNYDPGVPVVWAGFSLMLAGLCINFIFYYRIIYVVNALDGKLLVAGYTIGHKEEFRAEFEECTKGF